MRTHTTWCILDVSHSFDAWHSNTGDKVRPVNRSYVHLIERTDDDNNSTVNLTTMVTYVIETFYRSDRIEQIAIYFRVTV